MAGLIIGIIVGIILTILCTAIFCCTDNEEVRVTCVFTYILLCLLLCILPIGIGVECIETDAKLEGVREYVENPQKYKVTRILSRLEINYNDSIK